MTDDQRAVKTLMARLEAAISRIEDVTYMRGEQNQTQSRTISSPGMSVPEQTLETRSMSVAPVEVEDSPATKAFDSLVTEHLQPFISKSGTLPEPIPAQAQAFQAAIDEQRRIIVAASRSKQPSYTSTEFTDLLTPLQASLSSIGAIKDKARASPHFNHLSVVADGSPALGWVAVEKTPAPFIGDMKDSAQFYANRVIKDYKEKDATHVEWVRSFINFLIQLQTYVRTNHTTGLSWNSSGIALKDYTSKTTNESASVGGPPPPPPGPPPPPMSLSDATPSAPAPPPAGDMNSVFADLNRGSSVTAGLKKVDKSQMTHKNPNLRASSVVPESKAVAATKPSTTTRTKRPPKKELEGTKWLIENFENDSNITIRDIELNHSVYVYNCTNSTITISGKFNAITLDNCKKTGLVVDTLVSSIDLVKSTSFALQVLNTCPTIICDSCDSGQIFLAKSALECEIMTSKCSSINVNLPTENDDFKEEAVPEMLKHVIVDGKLSTSIVEYHD